MEFFLAIYLATTFLSVFICRSVAKARGASITEWTVNAFIFSIFSIPFVFFCKPLKTSWHWHPSGKDISRQ